MENGQLVTRTCEALGLDLLPQTRLLYKFLGLRRDEIPEGIREVERKSDRKMDEKHAAQAVAAGQSHAAMSGRVRPDRTDTGIAIYQNRRWVRIGSIRTLLAAKGFVLTDIHFFQKPGAGCVTCMNLAQEGERLVLARKTVEGLQRLARENTFEVGGVFDNLNVGNPATINFKQRSKNPADSTLVVRDKDFLRLVDADDRNIIEVEREEEAAFGTEILATLEEILPYMKA